MSQLTLSNQPPARKVTKGKFEEGRWYCDCDPPAPASFLQVKKKTSNFGKWFYTCPLPRDTQCSFFMFEEEAKTLEKKALLAKSPVTPPLPNLSNTTAHEVNRAQTPHSEAASVLTGGPSFSPVSSVFPTPAPEWRHTGSLAPALDRESTSDEESGGTANGRYRQPATPTPKRKRSAADAGQARTVNISDDFDSDDDEVMAEMAELADRSERLHQSQPSQRSRQSQFSTGPVTPDQRTRQVGLGGLPTPTSGNSFSAATATEPGAKRFRASGSQLSQPTPTPTPSRTRDTLAGGGGADDNGYHSEGDAEITTAVLGLLRTEAVSPPVRRTVRETLNLHALRGRGVERGRDVLREGIRKKDQRIAELQARVVALEGERTMRREGLRRAASELEVLLCQEEGDEGGGEA